MSIDRDTAAPSSKRRSIVGAGIGIGMLGIAGGFTGIYYAAPERPARHLDVPYEPTPQPVVDAMLLLAQVNRNDLLYDLGCGDGRIVISAAKQYGARGIGIDLDPQRVTEAKANAKQAAVEDRVHFMVGDLFASNFSDATVVTLFLWPQVNLKLRPLLWQQLQVGTRVVSYIWDMGPEWLAEKIVPVQGKKIYCWTITEQQKQAMDKPARRHGGSTMPVRDDVGSWLAMHDMKAATVFRP